MPSVYVLDVPEFLSLVADAQKRPDCRVARVNGDYWRIDSDQPLEFSRKALGLKPAVWYGLFNGGLDGSIERFDKDIVRIVAA